MNPYVIVLFLPRALDTASVDTTCNAASWRLAGIQKAAQVTKHGSTWRRGFAHAEYGSDTTQDGLVLPLVASP